MRNLKHSLGILLAILLIAACTSEVQPLPDDCEVDIVLTIGTQQNANCGQSDGSVTINATGGSGTYMYQLGNAAAQASPTFNNLAAGTYTITVTDDGACSTEINVQIMNLDGVNATFAATESDCDNPTGTITATATDGVQPYEYRIDGGAFQSNATFSALSPGDYTVAVRDANGCEVEQEVNIKSDVTFAAVRAIVDTNCAISGCHDGTISPDMRSNGGVVGSAGRIRARTSARTMPPASRPDLTDAEIDAIACWVADGASTN